MIQYEQLKNAFYNLAQSYEKEKRNKEQTEILFKGLSLINNEDSPEKMFEDLNFLIKAQINFDECILLKSYHHGLTNLNEQAKVHIINSSFKKAPKKNFYTPSKKLETILLRDQNTIIFELTADYKLDGYLDELGSDKFNSAIIIPYVINDIRYISIFLSEKRSFFTINDSTLLNKLIPVVKQAINKSLYLSNLISQSKLASFGEMSAGIAHEINNPLMIILSNLNLIQRLFENKNKLVESEEKIRKLVDSSIQTSKRVTSIVDGMHSLSKEKLLSNVDHISMNDLISHSLELCQIKLKSKNIEVQIDIDSIFNNYLLEVDTIQLSQVIINLISNSIDSIQDKDEQWIKLSCFILQEGEIQKVIINVIDSGNGINLKNRELIFQPFHTTKRFQEGTGLGLSISRTIIEKMSGKIYVCSKIPNTCFTIELPKDILIKALL